VHAHEVLDAGRCRVRSREVVTAARAGVRGRKEASQDAQDGAYNACRRCGREDGGAVA
jgi:hypothetical protein